MKPRKGHAPWYGRCLANNAAEWATKPRRPRWCRLGRETEGKTCEQGLPALAICVLRIGRKRRSLCGICARIETGAAIDFGESFSVSPIEN